jgi:iron-sulfur cluster repair protein YtfE (RIC family)
MTRRGGLTALDGAIALIAFLLIVQMWLLTATLEAYIAGHAEPILPAAIISGLIFILVVACSCLSTALTPTSRRKATETDMLVKIGPLDEPSDIVDLLKECHERIRTNINLAGRLATTEGISDTEVRDAAGRVARYFTEALPLHVADEEESILPRLQGKSAELDAALSEMHEEHTQHDPHVESLLNLCRSLRESPENLNELRPKLLASAVRLEQEFLSHLDKEEKVILPAIRQLSTPEERDVMLRELRARRT